MPAQSSPEVPVGSGEAPEKGLRPGALALATSVAVIVVALVLVPQMNPDLREALAIGLMAVAAMFAACAYVLLGRLKR